MWIVMTSAAHVPGNGPYRNVACVKLDAAAAALYQLNGHLPRMISARARGIEKVLHLGHHFVGKTQRSAYHRALNQANAQCDEFNALETIAA